MSDSPAPSRRSQRLLEKQMRRSKGKEKERDEDDSQELQEVDLVDVEEFLGAGPAKMLEGKQLRETEGTAGRALRWLQWIVATLAALLFLCLVGVVVVGLLGARDQVSPGSFVGRNSRPATVVLNLLLDAGHGMRPALLGAVDKFWDGLAMMFGSHGPPVPL